MLTTLLAAASIGEALFGVFVFAVPGLAYNLLFGGEPAASGIIMARVTGIALVGLGIACYPSGTRQGFYAMLAYGVLVMLFLIAEGVGGSAGIFLWPGVAIHALLSLALIVAARAEWSKR